MYNRVLYFLSINDILVKNQYGFREKRSTYMALLQIVDDIFSELDTKNNSIGVFIDLSKAFDTIDHKLLIKKLSHYGIREVVLNWFISYLSNRKKYVYLNSTISPSLHINCGVPQGSILGPLLLII